MHNIEYFVSNDAQPILSHTNRIIFLEDGDLASIVDGSLMLQRVGEDERREFADFSEVESEIQQLMKGDYPTFMIKEIKEQPETIVNVSRGRVNYEESSVALGGLSKHIGEIKRSSAKANRDSWMWNI
ncbi:Oidioi.mRNA.OKI2018_I69.chr2.g6285.t1.cds [Oikopleura dioica]|uniref:Oidioi.mRNA.OKI2018_I69.chr2.g6285.t1.cds n=1 Tax=Oikopleura dioica TaxID=34765 RepID=A0ABN7T3F8_OIKDI|nr:Oidioi.mRNA.OKI2018_I69.chr2.g6285.t1.cds [Oikopleura dioica]